MRYWKFLVIAILVISCGNRNINTLNHKKIKFEDLPIEVSQYLRNPTDYQNDIQTMLLELPKEKEKNYRLETVKTLTGPWVAYEKLINTKENISYRIDRGVPSPYIVFENKLYVSDRYNIFTTVDDIDSVEFTQYDLKK
jgi:hypothetical protein